MNITGFLFVIVGVLVYMLFKIDSLLYEIRKINENVLFEIKNLDDTLKIIHTEIELINCKIKESGIE